MKFVLSSLQSSGIRSGIISNISRLPGVELETPLLLIYTRGGSIPHVVRDVLELLTQEQIAIQVPLPSTIQCFEGVKGYEKGISQFAGLKEMVTYCTVQDPAVKTNEGYNSKSQISVWSHSGRVPLTVDKYMEIMEAFQPDMYEALSNSDTNIKSTRKKVKKVQESSLYLLEECLEKHSNSSALKASGIFGSVEGGYDVDLRKLSAQILSSKALDGFVINGLHNNGPEVEEIDFEAVKPILEVVLKNLPQDKPRIIHGCWRPEIVLQMIDLGIDIFDSSLPYIVAERKCALVFRFREIDEGSSQLKQKTDDSNYQIKITDVKHKEELIPILDGCTCLTCRKHTRAYIFHLEENNELLARTLLMLHNLHHYMEFFKSIRRAASQGKKICIS